MCEAQLMLNDVHGTLRNFRRLFRSHASEVSHFDGLGGPGTLSGQRLQRRVQIEQLHQVITLL
jgi:hypothetical protein